MPSGVEHPGLYRLDLSDAITVAIIDAVRR